MILEFNSHICTRDATILQYINVLQYIATFIAFKVVSIRLLHYKNDWTSCNHKYTIQFLAILHVSTLLKTSLKT